VGDARIVAQRVRTWFRIPLLQGFNDSLEDMKILADMAGNFGVEKISFLPYHEGGLAKSLQLGKAPPSWSIKPPTEEHIQKIDIEVVDCQAEGISWDKLEKRIEQFDNNFTLHFRGSVPENSALDSQTISLPWQPKHPGSPSWHVCLYRPSTR
jgi:hypothetical protein